MLQVFEADAYECDDALRHAAAKFMAVATQYNFLVHCESRTRAGGARAVPLGERLLMHTRDFLNMGECGLSWLDGVAEGVTHGNLTVVVITDGVSIDITDWGTPYTTPEDYQDSDRRRRALHVGLPQRPLHAGRDGLARGADRHARRRSPAELTDGDAQALLALRRDVASTR